MCVSSFGQLAAFAPNSHIAGLLIPMAVVFAALFCAELQPPLRLPKSGHLHHYASPFSLSVEYVPFPHTTKMLMLLRGLITLFPHLQDLGYLGFGR
jgi:hypothetical protein